MSAGPTPKGQPAPAVSRDLSLLAPMFRSAVIAAINDANLDGLDAYVYEAKRSHELAVLYFARGRTVIPPTKPVTNAPNETYSFHGYGLAVDVISRSKQWNRPESWFRRVAEHFARHGCKWGGLWRMKDLPHFQSANLKASPSDEARRLLREGGVEAVWERVGAN